MTEYICDNVLDLDNGIIKLSKDSNYGLFDDTYCQWSILAPDDDMYVILEFQMLNVRNITAIKEWFNCVNSNSSQLL